MYPKVLAPRDLIEWQYQPQPASTECLQKVPVILVALCYKQCFMISLGYRRMRQLNLHASGGFWRGDQFFRPQSWVSRSGKNDWSASRQKVGQYIQAAMI